MPFVHYDFDEFLEIYDDKLYEYYMESGAYYDTDREAFDESEYYDYLQEKGIWSRRKQAKLM